jgi:hypothetical protein
MKVGFSAPSCSGRGLISCASLLRNSACTIAFSVCISMDSRAVDFGEWQTESGVQVAPIYSPQSSAVGGPLLSLRRGQEAGAVRISESGNVNSLRIENSSDEPVLLVAGEIVEGGLQDRAIAHDVIVPAGASDEIAVFCVEQGRWSAGADGPQEFKASGLFVDGDARVSAQADGAMSANQMAVWSHVTEALGGLSANAPTSNYGDIRDSEAYDRITEVAMRLRGKLGDDAGMVGLAVAYGGQVQKIEYFGDPRTFAQYRDDLIQSYVATALKESREGSVVDRRALDEFADAFVSSEVREFELPEGKRVELAGRDMAVFELFDRQGRCVHYQKARRKPAKLGFSSGTFADDARAQRILTLQVLDDQTGAPVASPIVVTDPPQSLIRCDVLKDGSGTVFMVASVPPGGVVRAKVSSPTHGPASIQLGESDGDIRQVRLPPLVLRIAW